MADPYPIRPITAAEFPAFHAVDDHAFNSIRSAEDREDELRRLEFDRTLAAWDGELIVGVAAAFSLQLAVPAAVVPAAGVTWVSVLPTHRRRGILRSLMLRQLAGVRARGEAVAALFASESGIYSRYGYGPASVWADYSFRSGEGGLRPDAPADDSLRLRIADPDTVRPELAKVHDAVFPTRPGMFARDDGWWEHRLYDPETRRDGATPLRCVLAEDASGPRGYGLYTGKNEWGRHFLADGTLRIRELMAADPAAAAALWRDLLSRDLISEVEVASRPPDDPLMHMLADPRRARARVSDALWVRLVDVGAALTQRRYACAADVVIDVADEACGWNTGRWRLRTRGAGSGGSVTASCERTSDPPDVALPVRALGAAYLGGTRLGSLAGAGVVTELRGGAVAELSAALSWDPAPWCPMVF
jgi:predicted acetyltransferase